MPREKNTWRRLGSAVLLACAVIVVLSAASTSSARFSAQTDNQNNLWEAANLELTIESGGELFLDGNGLYPGLVLENCVVVTYVGSIDDVDVRLHVQPSSGTLDRFFVIEIEVGTGLETDCSDFTPARSPFAGTLSNMFAAHGSFESGLLLAEDIETGSAVTIRARGEVMDTNDAQGLSGRFRAFVEVRQ